MTVASVLELVALLGLAVASVALAVIDVRHRRLPNRIVLPGYPGAGLPLAAAALLRHDAAALIGSAVVGAGLFAFYLLLALPARGMGMGDVKLAGVLGLYLGHFGTAASVLGACLPFLLGAVYAAGAILLRRAGPRSRIPFGPFMLLGAWLALLAGAVLPE